MPSDIIFLCGSVSLMLLPLFASAVSNCYVSIVVPDFIQTLRDLSSPLSTILIGLERHQNNEKPITLFIRQAKQFFDVKVVCRGERQRKTEIRREIANRGTLRG